MWLSKDYSKLKHLKVESVSGKKTVHMCHVSQCWSFMSLPNQTGLFLLPSCCPHCSTLLKGRAWHQNPSCFLSPPLEGQQEKESSELASLCLPCCASLSHQMKGMCHPAGTCYALGSQGKRSWDLQSPEIAEKSPSLSYLLQQLRYRVSMNSQQINNFSSFCLIGKSGVGMSWCSWVWPPARGTSLGRHSGTWPFQVGFSAFNPERSTCRTPAGVQILCWETNLPAQSKENARHFYFSLGTRSLARMKRLCWEDFNSAADIREQGNLRPHFIP